LQMRLHSGRDRPENIGWIEHIDVFVEYENVFGVVEGQGGGGGARRIAFGQLFHRDKNIVVRVPALLADGGNAGDRFTAATQVSTFARQIHPGLVTFRRDDRLIHGAVTVVDRLHFVVHAGRVALWSEIARRFAERSFDHAAARPEHAFDHDFRIRRN